MLSKRVFWQRSAFIHQHVIEYVQLATLARQSSGAHEGELDGEYDARHSFRAHERWVAEHVWIRQCVLRTFLVTRASQKWRLALRSLQSQRAKVQKTPDVHLDGIMGDGGPLSRHT